MKITIRTRILKTGSRSIYLDFYEKGKRWIEYLNLFLVPDDAEFLTRSYFRYFEGREFTEIRTFLILTQEAQRSQFIQYDPKRWLDFHAKVSKTDDIQYGNIAIPQSGKAAEQECPFGCLVGCRSLD